MTNSEKQTYRGVFDGFLASSTLDSFLQHAAANATRSHHVKVYLNTAQWELVATETITTIDPGLFMLIWIPIDMPKEQAIKRMKDDLERWLAL